MKIDLSYQAKGALPANRGGVPAGGAPGQVLAKVDGINYNTAWTDGVPGPPGPDGPAGPAGSSSSVFDYRLDATTTAPNDPGAARYRYNTTTQSAATALYMDRLDLDDFDVTAIFATLKADDQLIIQEPDLAAHFQQWRVLGPAIGYSDWFEVPVQFVTSTGTVFANLERVSFIIKVVGAPGPGVSAGGTTNQVLTKLSDADYDTVWVGPTPDLATFEYMFDTAIVAPAGNANIRFNSATMTAVTKVWANHTTSTGLDTTNVFTLVEDGVRIFVQDKDDATRWASFNCTGPTINKGTYDEFPVVFRDKGPASLVAQRVLLNMSGSGVASLALARELEELRARVAALEAL